MKLDNTVLSKRTFAKEKGEQMDRLSLESTEALALGMTYGQYKAYQKEHRLDELPKPRKPEKPRAPQPSDPKEEKGLACAVCGQKFIYWHRGRKYCSEACKEKAARARERERKGLTDEVPAPKICTVCGKEITNRPGARKYCSVECYNTSNFSSYRKRIKEAQEHGTE